MVHGDALDAPEQRDLLRQRLGGALDGLDVVSATAYLGAAEIAQALVAGAQIVVAGRVADPSLTLGPALAHFGWDAADWPRLGRATIAGHMLECGLQVTGGYFSVPGLKDVPDLHQAGFPIAEIQSDGGFVIGKADGTGGMVDARTAKEQLLYEVHDPARYLTPDVTADLSQARVVELGADRVAVQGVTGHARPDELKVNVCYRGGWLAEAEISYAGVQAEARAPAGGGHRAPAPGFGAAAARRSHRRGQRAGRRRRQHAGRLARRPGARRAPAPGRDARRARPGRTAAARSDRALHLRPGRRRRRAHRPAAAPEHDVLHHPARRGARRLALPGEIPQ